MSLSAVLPRSRVSHEQVDMLLSFMEEHPEFAAGKQSIYSRFSASKLWRLLAERLNAAAPDSAGARKSPDKWCRYWADIKYKARKKTAAGGALGELSHVEERLKAVLGVGGPAARAGDDEVERKPGALLLDDGGEAGDDGGGEGAEGEGGGARLSTEELLAEAAMRTALAAEKQAEAVAQAVELLRELVSVLRRDPVPPAHPAHPAPPLHHAAPDHHTHTPHTLHTHHRLQ